MVVVVEVVASTVDVVGVEVVAVVVAFP